MAAYEGHELHLPDKGKQLKARIKMVRKAIRALEWTTKRMRGAGVSRDQALFAAAEMLGIPLGRGPHGDH